MEKTRCRFFNKGVNNVKKIFIDCGAHMGESLEAFCKLYEDSEEYQAYCFEDSAKKQFKVSFEHISKKCLEQNKIKSAEWFNKAVWVEDGEITFYDAGGEGSSVIERKYGQNPRKIECFDLSSWIKRNFSLEDHIILKIDLEGAEYEVLNKMYNDKTIDYINKIYCELHGLKCGRSIEESVELIEKAEKFNHKLYIWCANTINKQNLNNYYTIYALLRDDKKWKLRRINDIKSYINQILGASEKNQSLLDSQARIKEFMLKNNTNWYRVELEVSMPGDIIQCQVLYKVKNENYDLSAEIERVDLKYSNLEKLLEETGEIL